MNIADRIMNLRKKERWSQEELAERLGVSRQSVSKWESGASIPDLNRILEMSDLFHVSTDYLLKGDGNYDENGHSGGTQEKIMLTVDEPAGRLMSVEEINRFMEATAEYARKVAVGVMLCILSPVVLIGCAGFVDENGSGPVSERTAMLVGLLCLFILVACAVMLFIRGASRMKPYDFVKKGDFYLEQGSITVIEGVLTDFEPQFSSGVARGVALCIMSPVPLIVMALLGFGDQWVVLMVPVLLLLVAIGVNGFVRLSIVKDGFLLLLKRKEFTAAADPGAAENARREEKLGGIFWPIIVAVYLLWSFIGGSWHISWVIFPIAGLIFAALSNAVKK